MQCLTMDCCGMGRAVEAGFDAAACVWWIAGGITLGVRATEANAAGIERQNERNAVVALCWISAFMFLALLVTNLVREKGLAWLGHSTFMCYVQKKVHLICVFVFVRCVSTCNSSTYVGVVSRHTNSCVVCETQSQLSHDVRHIMKLTSAMQQYITAVEAQWSGSQTAMQQF